MPKENPQFLSDITLQRTKKPNIPTLLSNKGRATRSSMTLDWSCSSTLSSEFQSQLCGDSWVTLGKPWISPRPQLLTWSSTDLGSYLTSLLWLMFSNLSQPSGFLDSPGVNFQSLKCWIVGLLNSLLFVVLKMVNSIIKQMVCKLFI